MRLRLTIQRHGLPMTRVLWTTSSGWPLPSNPDSALSSFSSVSSSTITSTRAPNAGFAANTVTSGSGGYTIAQLLEDVNEVLPLETQVGDVDSQCGGGQWGLEDYVVEVGGFECLHFMQVDGLLRDGDEVVIRALQSADLTSRRLTGRHQISADGRHLIDGVPFGKPYLRRSVSSRPAITIPPRKRRRLTFGGWDADMDLGDDDDYGWDCDEHGNEANGMRLVSMIEPGTPGPNVKTLAPRNGSDDDHDDLDSDIPDRDEESILEELRDLEDEAKEAAAKPEFPRHPESALEIVGCPIRISSTPHVGCPIPGETRVPDPSPSLSPQLGDKNTKNLLPSPQHKKTVRFKKPTNISDRKDSDSVEESEENGSDTSSAGDESGDSSDSSLDDSSISQSSSASSSDGDLSSSDSENIKRVVPPNVESTPSKLQKQRLAQNASEPIVNAPGKGSRRTKNQNQRNKLRRRLLKMKQAGILPPEANFNDLRVWDAAKPNKHPRAAENKPKKSAMGGDDQSEFEIRRARLLRDLENGGVNVDEASDKENNQMPEVRCMDIDSRPKITGQPVHTFISSVDSVFDTSSESKKGRMKLDVASSRRLLFGSLGLRNPKTKQDEENARKQLAEKTAQPTIFKRILTEDTDCHSKNSQEADAVENWEDKIVLRATECVYEDLALAPPPFPFVQRWDQDSIQRYKEMHRGKGKKRKRRSRNLVGGYYDGCGGDLAYSGSRPGTGSGDVGDTDLVKFTGQSSLEENGEVRDAIRNQPMPDADDFSAVSPEKQLTSLDFPDLPDDLASFAPILESEVRPGAVIAFKQLDMSKATNWQPLISNYRTSIVEEVMEDSVIRLRLAERDKKASNRSCDDGNPRQYSKFEMPGYDEGEEEDDGVREIPFGEMIEPKLLRPASSPIPTEEVEETQNSGLPDRILASVPGYTTEIDGETVSSSARNEICQMILDAGFRTAIDSDLLIPGAGAIDVEQQASGMNQDEKGSINGGNDSPIVRSPTFAGFTSSPPSRMSVLSRADVSVMKLSDPQTRKDPANTQPANPDLLVNDSSPHICTAQANLNPVQSEPLLLSDDGLQYITNGDSGGAGADEEESSHSLTAGTFPPSYQPEPAELSQVDSLVSTIPPTAAGNSIPDARPVSHASSTVTNPFYDIDRESEVVLSDLSPVIQLFASRTSPLPTGASKLSTPKKQSRLLSPHAEQPVPPQLNASYDSRIDLPAIAEAENRSSFDPGLSASQLPNGSYVVDLTFSSDRVSSEDSDEDFAESPGLPRGPGWVQKRTGGPRVRTRSFTRKVNAEEGTITRTRRGKRRLSKSVI